jgi:hypothetical protein
LSFNENNTLLSLIPVNFCPDFELKDRIILLASSGYFLRNFNSNEKKLDLLFGFLIRITYNNTVSNNEHTNKKSNSILDDNHKIKSEKKVLKKAQKNNVTNEDKPKESIIQQQDYLTKIEEFKNRLLSNQSKDSQASQ